jgi:hypothetical protein
MFLMLNAAGDVPAAVTVAELIQSSGHELDDVSAATYVQV